MRWTMSSAIAHHRPLDDCFFFQAEDGIRDTSVTGVQTCALPIYTSAVEVDTPPTPIVDTWAPPRYRSEERRVGKECRSRWLQAHSKNRKSTFAVGRMSRSITCPPAGRRCLIPVCAADHISQTSDR